MLLEDQRFALKQLYTGKRIELKQNKTKQKKWPISPNLFKITTELLLVMDRKSYMKFHLTPLSLTLSDLERSIQVTQVFNGLSYISTSIQDNHRVTIDDE